MAFFRRQTDEHDERDLPVDVEIVISQEQAGEGSENCDRHGQQHAERERPALVEGGEMRKTQTNESRKIRLPVPEALRCWYEMSATRIPSRRGRTSFGDVLAAPDIAWSEL